MKEIKLDFINKTTEDPKLENFDGSSNFDFDDRISKLSDDLKKKYLLINPRLIIESIYSGDLVERKDHLLNYIYTFNYKTGYSTRTDILDKNKEDVFAASFPHLIDVGIMGHCSHGKSGLCLKSGVQCYQDGLNVFEPNMSLDNFKKIAEECKDLTNQFALGGRGDPNEHEHFEEILKICNENRIVPNYTTSGFNLTEKQIELTKRYCGAVAVSWYRNTYTTEAINRFVDAGIKTNIHFVLNNETIDEAIDMLTNDGFPKGVNAVVFLTHKPVGLGQTSKCLRPSDQRITKLLQLFKDKKFPFKYGVDGCFVVAMINSEIEYNMEYFDTCEAARFTCYIDANLIMHPCSFNTNEKYTYDLKTGTILEGWNSDAFEEVRNTLLKGCPSCEHNNICHGGCFMYKDIILCGRKGEMI